ncbi:MAG TPA: hypothetical protein VHY83_13545 [Solirubrobacteraceae bacterium]|nr:hypothetical protein [Solirubrobacteraceae bacterium]
MLTPDPFGEIREPWWRRIWRENPGGAPRRYLGPAGSIGALAVLLLPTHGLDHASRTALGFVLVVAPPALVELWWKRRQRRAEEQLLVYPEERALD